MNNGLLNQIPADEQPVASQLAALVEDMQLSQTFEWELENQLMEKYQTKTGPLQPAWYTRIIPSLGWAIAALGAVLLLNWTLRSLVPGLQPAAGETPMPAMSFEESVRQGNICAGPLALAHNFSVSLTNEDKTGFVMLDGQTAIEEVRSFAWSPDGRRLAVVGNMAGGGNISVTDFGKSLQYVISNSEVGYLRDAAWSRDGKQFVMWSSQNISTLFVVNADGKRLIELQLDAQIFGTPQFAPDGKSILFYGVDSSQSDGLLQSMVDGSGTRMISDLVEDASSFAWSPDGARLAYIEMDRELVKARLIAEDFAAGSKVVLATLPILKSGYSLPDSANLSWSPDGKSLIFDLGRGASDRAVYLAHADGTGLVKLAHAAHAPTISVDGRCVAYISEKQVFVLELADTSVSSTATPVFLADLPPGHGIAGSPLDKLQWRP
jgi:Tol biopolymer transport system component